MKHTMPLVALAVSFSAWAIITWNHRKIVPEFSSASKLWSESCHVRNMVACPVHLRLIIMLSYFIQF